MKKVCFKIFVIFSEKKKPLTNQDYERNQARSQEFAMKGLFWRQETTDFGSSSIRLSLIFCPNLGDLQKKKRSSAKLKPSFSGQNLIRILTNFHRQCQWGGYFRF